MPNQVADVIVVGAGNAAFCAALSAQEQGAKVVMCERRRRTKCGGNSRFTGGLIRVVYNGVDDIKTLVPDLTPAEIETTDFGTYTADQFFDDMARVTQYRIDPDLAELLVTKSFDRELDARAGRAVHSELRPAGVQGRRQVQVLGGLTVESVGGGPGLMAMLTESASAASRSAMPRAASICCSTAIASRAFACARTAKCANCARKRWCSPAAASRPTANGARAISARAGTWRRCAARATTPATASAWRSTSARSPTASGRAATRCVGALRADFGDVDGGDQLR